MKKILTAPPILIFISAAAIGQNNLLPASVTFERTVVQQQNGEDGKPTNTYYFTINGDYAMAKKKTV